MNLCLPNWYTFVSWDFDLRKITFIFPNKIVFASIPKQQKKRLAGNLVSVFLQNSIPLPFLEFYEKIWRSTKTGKIRKHLVSRTTRFSSLFVLDKSQCFSWRCPVPLWSVTDPHISCSIKLLLKVCYHHSLFKRKVSFPASNVAINAILGALSTVTVTPKQPVFCFQNHSY